MSYLLQDDFKVLRDDFISCCGDIMHAGIPLAACLQVPLYSLVSARLQSDPASRVRQHLQAWRHRLQPGTWVARLKTCGALSASEPDGEDASQGDIAGRCLFLIQNVSISGIDTLRGVWERMDRDEYLITGLAAVRDKTRTRLPELIDYEHLVGPMPAPDYSEPAARLIKAARNCRAPVFRSRLFRHWAAAWTLRLLHYSECFQRLLSYRPGCIVSADDTKPEGMLLARLAAAADIPSVVVEHALPIAGWNVSRLPVSSAAACVYGDLDRDWYLSQGVPEDKINITGQPRLDHFFTDAPVERGVFFQGLDLDPSKPTVVLATAPVGKRLCARLLRAVQTGLKQTGRDCNLLVRVHPGERPGFYGRMLHGRAGAAIARAEGRFSLFDTLSHADIVVTYMSNVALEAILLKKPVIIADLTGKPALTDYVEHGAAVPARDAAGIADAVLKLLDDTAFGQDLIVKCRAYTEKKYASRDGRAGERVAELIRALTRKGSGQ